VRDHRLDEAVTIDVVTTVDVEIDVVVVEEVDGELVADVVIVSVADVGVVDEVIAVVVGVDSVDVDDKIVLEVEMGAVDTVVDGVVDNAVRVELSIGKILTALAVLMLETTPATATKRISVNTIRTAADFILLSLLPLSIII